jgi:3-oxoacyl-[acyl-carrier protein] reductase
VLTAGLSAMAAPYVAGLSAACAAVEGMTRSLAGELGASGIRVNCVRASAMAETRTIRETSTRLAALGAPPRIPARPLGRPLTVAETAATAAYLASDRASGMTGQVVVL